jgi:hypothetical protein
MNPDVTPAPVLSEFGQVVEMMAEAAQYGLTAEVVVFALKFCRDNPDWSAPQCVSAAMCEWVK